MTAAWSSEVTATSARLSGEIAPDPGQSTKYYFSYLPDRTYRENIEAGREPFANASEKPSFPATIPAGESAATVTVRLTGLVSEVSYRYRLLAYNGSGPSESGAEELTTQPGGRPLTLPDSRGWEMVSPVDKGGGQVDASGEDAGGGVMQAAANGSSLTFSSAVSFGSGEGAPPGAQYISRRGEGGWSTQNVTAPMVSGSYETTGNGVPYQLFSENLAYALMLNGDHCREGGAGCPVENPPLAGSGAPAGYQNYYRRDNAANSFRALLTSGPLALTPLSSSQFSVRLAGATPDLGHVVLSSCAKLTSNATESGGGGGGCEPNLYEWSGEVLSLVNVLPGQTNGTPGARLGAAVGAISSDGARVYFGIGEGGPLYLHEGSETKLLPETSGGGAAFQTASADGSVAFFTAGGHLYRYEAATGAATDLTPAGGVLGVLGASPDGSYLYYQTTAGLYLRHGSTVKEVAAGSEATASSDYPPAAATVRIATDGTLFFLSDGSLSGYDNTSLSSGEAVSEVFLYKPGAPESACLSCNPTGERPLGASTIPGSIANGTVPGSTDAYRPRALSASGERLFFDSIDTLVPQDSNGASDVYEWEADGTGTCREGDGCLALVSSGKSSGAFFVDAAAEGEDVFFRTDRSLVPADPGSYDVYDARVGGGFPEPLPPIECEGDACQHLPSPPVDPVINTLQTGAGNPRVHFYNTTRHKPVYHRLRHHHHKGRGGHKRRHGRRRHGGRHHRRSHPRGRGR